MIRLDTGTSSLDVKCLHHTIGAFDVSLRSELDEVLEDFAALYRGYPDGDTPSDKTIRMDVREAKWSPLRRRRYLVLGDGEGIGEQRRREEILPFLEWGINWRVITRGKDFLQLHAATMAYAGQGVVLAAGSGEGKSTLAAGLLARGWKYLSDEFALIDPHTLRLHPFPKAICIKGGSFEIVRRLHLPFAGRRYYVKGLKGRVGYVNPHDVGGESIADASPIRLVLFPRYTEGRPLRLHPLKPARAAFGLAGCALNRNVFADRAVSILSDVVRGTDCFALESSSLDDACDLIESLFAGAPT